MRTIHWFRNDLRIRDNTALTAAVERADELLPVFILDPHLFDVVVRPVPRLRFLLDCLRRLAGDLAQRGSVLAVRTGDPVREIPRLMEETGADLRAVALERFAAARNRHRR